MRKVVLRAFSEDVTTASSDAQMCGWSSGSDAAIHGMRRMFQNKSSDAVILFDTGIVFNSLNWKEFLHSIKYIFPEIAVYVNNY